MHTDRNYVFQNPVSNMIIARGSSPSEQILWEYLKKNQLGVKFRRQHPIHKYIADFYCHQLKLVIEIDGGYHLGSDQKEYEVV